MLVVVAGAIFSHGVAMNGPAAGLGPWLVGSLVWGIGLSLGSTTGYAINPARDLGPRIAHALCRSPAKADRTGAMLRFRSSAILPAELLRDCCSTTRIMRIAKQLEFRPSFPQWTFAAPIVVDLIADTFLQNRDAARVTPSWSLQAGGNDCQSCDGGGFSAHDARA